MYIATGIVNKEGMGSSSVFSYTHCVKAKSVDEAENKVLMYYKNKSDFPGEYKVVTIDIFEPIGFDLDIK